MHNPDVIEETRHVLKRLGFEYREAWHSPSKVAVAPSKPSGNQKNWADRCVFTINGGWRERYRFLAEVSPVRRGKLVDTLYGQLKTEPAKLERVEPAGLQDVHWLETETGNYVIEGFCSSNSFADSYGVLLERKVLKERRHPATDDGTLDGKPVLLEPKKWAEVKLAQRSTVNAQMLLNPLAGNESTFRMSSLRHYDVVPSVLNVYIIVDPSMGRSKRSDNTAIAVVGIDVAGNKYLLDGYCHRMKLSRRWELMSQLEKKWSVRGGVQICRVGYERYGMQSDLEVIEEYQERDKHYFEIIELNSTKDGTKSKDDRIQRMEPDLNRGVLYLPAVTYHPDFGGSHNNAALWDIWTVEDDKRMVEAGAGAKSPPIDSVVYRPMMGPTRHQKVMDATFQAFRIVTALRRRNEDGDMYDLTRIFIEELKFHPFAPHDDLIDAVSRIYDMEPMKPITFESMAAEPTAHPDA